MIEALAWFTVGLVALQGLALLLRLAAWPMKRKRRRRPQPVDSENYGLWVALAFLVGLSSAVAGWAFGK